MFGFRHMKQALQMEDAKGVGAEVHTCKIKVMSGMHIPAALLGRLTG
jgi:hypothetical protein